jgi:hypothetical protein
MLMLHYSLRFMSVLTALCLLPVLLIRAQPYDDHELRTVLTAPEGCPAPCFIGIRPGVTPDEDAHAILKQSGWIRPEPPLRPPARWYWSGLHPDWIDPQTNGVLEADYLEFKLLVPVGSLKLLLGEPDREQYRPWMVLYGMGAAFQYSAWYAETGIEITATGLCPIRRSQFHFNAPTIIYIRNSPPRWSPDLQPVPCD